MAACGVDGDVARLLPLPSPDVSVNTVARALDA